MMTPQQQAAWKQECADDDAVVKRIYGWLSQNNIKLPENDVHGDSAEMLVGMIQGMIIRARRGEPEL